MTRPQFPIDENATGQYRSAGAFPDLDNGPFVGNATVDDNIAEGVRIALSNAHARPGDIIVSVADGVVRLTGSVDGIRRKNAVTAAARAASGVRGVIDEIDVRPSPRMPPTAAGPAIERPVELRRDDAGSMVYITRFCSLEQSSITAAVRQAVPELTAFFDKFGETPPENIILVYRNRLGEAVTVDIGLPADLQLAGHVEGQIKAGPLPGSPVESVHHDQRSGSLVHAYEALEAMARKSVSPAGHHIWQNLPDMASFNGNWLLEPLNLSVDRSVGGV